MTLAETPLAPVPWTPPLARVEGTMLASAFEALLKGAVETEFPVRGVHSPRRAPFEPIFRLLADETSRRTLESHGTELVSSADASRAVSLTARDAELGRLSLALVPNDQLDAAMPALQRLAARRGGEGGAVLVLEDNPYLTPGVCPRRAARELGLPCVEPSDVASLRDSVDDALRLARVGGGAAAIVVHVSTLRSIGTLEARPNRVMDRVDAVLAMRRARRGPRAAEGLDVLRLGRRLELNQLLCLPSPGEREAWGFIAVGPCVVAAQHVLRELGLAGRVPLMRLGLVHPVDDAAAMRLLGRCRNVAVLEPRPGSVAGEIVAIAERARAAGEDPALLWWDRLPPDPDGQVPVLDANEPLRTSILARKVVHLLHSIRPNLQVASRLAVSQPDAESAPAPRRGETLGVSSALDAARQMLLEVSEELAAMETEGQATARTALAVEGAAVPAGDRLVVAELWDRRRFAAEGVAAVRQASRAAGARLFVLCDLSAEDEPDPERLARAAVPADAAARLLIRRGDLNDRPTFKGLLREAALWDGLSLVTGVDGPPPRRDVAALERALAEVDRLGFAPAQRLIWSAETACSLRPLATAALIERGLERGTDPLRTEFTVEFEAERGAVLPRLSATPLLEQVEVVRTRPPRIRVPAGTPRPPPPRVVHARAGLWRAHLAAYRGDPPGLAAMALCEAGRAMGYRVQAMHHTTPVGPGRRAWAQVLFTREEPGADAVLATGIPYGEADLVIGMDPVEALRAFGPDPFLRVAAPDRTHAILNVGPLRDQIDAASLEAASRLPAVAARACRPELMLAADVARACRRSFLTDRVVDLVLLGAAFQRGTIPVAVEALEAAMRRLESRGYGRSLEAFDFGRRLGADQAPAPHDLREAEEPLARLARRLVLETARDGRGGRRAASALRRLIDAQLSRMPELSATTEGQMAQRDLVVALHRCVMFGGIGHAQEYAEALGRLHERDPDAAEKEWTRLAVLPLAEVSLPRDLLYVTAMCTSIEQHRRTREQLEIRLARGDRIERRYLNRIEASAFGRRFRLDFRSSDWPARLVRGLRSLVPLAARGSPEDRLRRDAVVGLLERAVAEPQHARHWSSVLRALHARAVDGTILALTLEDLESLSRRV